jgi:hypothetical protein
MALSSTTLRTVVDDLMLDFRQIFDDKRLQKSQIAHWVIMLGNRLLMQHIGKRDSGQYLHIYGDVPIMVSATTQNPNIIAKRKYIELPANIFDFDKDGGVEYIAFYDEDGCGNPIQKTFGRTTPSDLRRMMKSTYEKPERNPVWYRAGDNIFLVGIECLNTRSVEIGIYSTIKPVTDPETDLDKPFRFPEELLIQLKRQVLDLGRFVMMIPDERTNDGADSAPMQQAPGKITSVAELMVDVPQKE